MLRKPTLVVVTIDVPNEDEYVNITTDDNKTTLTEGEINTLSQDESLIEGMPIS